MSAQKTFDVDVALARIRKAVAAFPRAALFELRDEGFTSAFEQLVACLVSIRTYDETTVAAARRLFKVARTPAGVLKLPPAEIAALIKPATFYENKAHQIHAIARQVVEEFKGELPCDYEVLTSLKGIGPKCANLVLGIACGQPRIGVDIHVHRVTNRWGYIAAQTPEASTLQLEAKLPREYWVTINELLVPFGKHICTGKLPQCSTCPVLEMCRQVGVTKHR